MTRLPASQMRNNVADTLNRVAYSGDRIILHRHGKDVAVLVPVEDAALLEALEDRMDIEAARKALKEGGRLSLDEVKAEFAP